MKTNSEKYKSAFKVLHTSEMFNVEVETMKEVKRISFRNIAKGITIAACVIVIIVSCTTVGNNCFTKEA